MTNPIQPRDAPPVPSTIGQDTTGKLWARRSLAHLQYDITGYRNGEMVALFPVVRLGLMTELPGLWLFRCSCGQTRIVNLTDLEHNPDKYLFCGNAAKHFGGRTQK